MELSRKYLHTSERAKLIILFILITNIIAEAWLFNRLINVSSKSIQFVMINIGLISILVGFLWILPDKISTLLASVLGILINIVFISNILFYNYYETFVSIGILKNIKLLGGLPLINILDILSDNKVGIIVSLSSMLIYIVTLIYLKYKNAFSRTSHKSGSLTAALMILLIGISSMKIGINRVESIEPFALTGMYNKEFIVKNAGLVYYQLADIGYYNRSRKYSYSDEEIAKAEKHLKSIAQYNNMNNVQLYTKGQFAGKNLIVMQVESLQDFVLGLRINGNEVTPNLNKLMSESIRLKNLYPQTSLGNTSDAEFAVNTSLLPLENESIYMSHINKNYESLPRLLKDKGYYTAALHANTPNYWNRSVAYKSLGFDIYENKNTFKLDEMTTMGLSDKSFFKQSIEKIKNYKQPFYAFTITLSSHFPFNEKLFKSFYVGSLEGKLLGDYLQAMHYTDEAIGELIQSLKDEGLWDSTILVIYGDHQAIPYNNYGELADFLAQPNSKISFEKNKKVAGIIHLPGEDKPLEIDKICGETDIMPTIAYLLGVDTKMATGKNIFSEGQANNYVIFKDKSFIYNNVYYSNEDKKAYSLDNYSEENIDSYKDIINDVNYIKANSDIYIHKR